MQFYVFHDYLLKIKKKQANIAHLYFTATSASLTETTSARTTMWKTTDGSEPEESTRITQPTAREYI